MTAERDAGFAALQQGDIPTAIAQLERACLNDPQDFQANLYLGAAYGQADRANDSVTAFTRAVQIQPENAQARYNLGVALENAGWKEQAVTVMQQALTLQPNYPQAQEALRRLQPVAPPPSIPAGMPPPQPMQPQMTPQYAAPGTAPYGAPQQPYGMAPPQQPYAPPNGAVPYGAPPASQPGYGLPPHQTMGGQMPGQMQGGMNTMYNPAAPARPMAPVVEKEPNLALGTIVGLAIAVFGGLLIGFMTVGMGTRIPFLSIIFGLLIGHAVPKASGDVGEKQGIIAAVCAGLGVLISVAIPYFTPDFVVSPYAILIVLFAISRGYRIGTGQGSF